MVTKVYQSETLFICEQHVRRNDSNLCHKAYLGFTCYTHAHLHTQVEHTLTHTHKC